MKTKKKRAPQDLTLRNLRALKKRLAMVEVLVYRAHLRLDAIEGTLMMKSEKSGRR
jgi:hypothetical protein